MQEKKIITLVKSILELMTKNRVIEMFGCTTIFFFFPPLVSCLKKRKTIGKKYWYLILIVQYSKIILKKY